MERYFIIRCVGVAIVWTIGICTLFNGLFLLTDQQNIMQQIYTQLVLLTAALIIGIAMICDILLNIERKIEKKER